MSIIFREPWLIAIIAAGTYAGLYVREIPGLSGAMVVSLLIAFTFGWGQHTTIAVMLGVYVGSNLHCESKNLRAMITGTLAGILALAVFAPLIASMSGRLRAVDYLMLSFMSLLIIISLSGKSLRAGLISACIGVFLGCVGVDGQTAIERFTFNVAYFDSGVDYVVAMIGLFGAAEAFTQISETKAKQADNHISSAIGGALIPTLVLGIPGDIVTAVLISALTIQGLRPGTNFIAQTPDIFWLIVASLLAAAITVFIFIRFGIKALAKITAIPKSILIPVILIFSVIGAYTIRNSVYDILCMFVFGFAGYVLNRFNYPVEPIAAGLVLNRLCEESFRRGVMVSGGSVRALLGSISKSYISIILFLLLVMLLVTQTGIYRNWKSKKSSS